MTRWLLLVTLAACGGAGANATPAAPAAPAAPSPPAEGIVVLDAAPPDALVLDVRAFRWACAIKHPHEVVTDVLRVPVARAIKLHVWTSEWPPYDAGIEVALVGTPVVKAVVRDKPVDIAFRIDRPGTYEWRCPTILPPQPHHDPDVVMSPQALDQQNPIRRFEAISAAQYDAFLEANDPDRPENVLALGMKVYATKGCNACHSLDGSPRVGPSWKGIWGTSVTGGDGSARVVDDKFVEESIVTPQAFVLKGYPAVMPSFEGQLRPREITAVAAFIQTLQ